MKWARQHVVLISILLVLIGLNVLYLYISPQEIVDAVGVSNSYIVVFLLATIGGVSSITGVALYSTLATFGAGGASPFLLALIGGIGIFLSDSIFFFLAYHGHKSIPEKWRRVMDRAFGWVKRHPKPLVLAVSYIYLGVLPLPSDLLMIVLALAGYSYRDVAPILLVSGITIAGIAATVGYAWI